MDGLNFPLILFLLTLATGIVWAIERFYSRKRREKDKHAPWWVDYPASFFPVLLVVFLLRSFVVEPFQIPSSSMRPTLEVGDFILVSKFSYGIRLPIIEKKIIPLGSPQRGDPVVFRFPDNPAQDFIKRVIGLPGDVVEYRGKQLTINGRVVPQVPAGDYNYTDAKRDAAGNTETDFSGRPVTFYETLRLFSETMMTGKAAEDAKRSYHIAVDPGMPPVELQQVELFQHHEACSYFGSGADVGFRCTVPEGYYWVMGDNRDRSLDSRYWGFVPDDYLRGRAFFIWFNWNDIKTFAFKRVGSSIQ